MNLIITLVEQIAVWGAGVVSMGYGYQPKTPDCLLK